MHSSNSSEENISCEEYGSSEEYSESFDFEQDEKNRKNIPTFIKYKAIWDKFAIICENNGILARDGFSCCNNCGTNDMFAEKADIEARDSAKHYFAYVFYHGQDEDFILEECEKEEKCISVYLGWNYFDDGCRMAKSDKTRMKLAKKIKIMAKSIGEECDMEYTSLKEKLLLKCYV